MTEQELRAWARANYLKFAPIDGVWHPTIQDECVKMNAETGYAPADANGGTAYGRKIIAITETNAFNGLRVVRRGNTIFIPLPRQYHTPTGFRGHCSCPTCDGKVESAWDTIAVTENPTKGPADTTWTVHAPEMQLGYPRTICTAENKLPR